MLKARRRVLLCSASYNLWTCAALRVPWKFAE